MSGPDARGRTRERKEGGLGADAGGAEESTNTFFLHFVSADE
jgi:hypothetical protein